MEEEDNVRTVNCLRGRLLAERMASRNAREEADKLGKKLVELENLLKEEAKSRNRAEKKLKFFMQRLESMNISDESHSSVSSTASSRIKEPEKIEIQQMSISAMENDESSKGSQNSIAEDSSTSDGKPNHQDYNDSEQRDFAYPSVESCTREGFKYEDDEEDPENHMDNSMALVPVDTPQKNHRSIDSKVLDATVKEVLDALRHAKEQLQSSMERRRMNVIRVG